MPSDIAAFPPDSVAARRLQELAGTQRAVFVAGVPGVGKSLLLRELARAAHAHGRRVHLLQWDVARRAFDAPPLLARYPEVGGITHAVLRKAAGLWARSAVADWNAAHPGDGAILVGEAPLIGHRFTELARPADDLVEPLLRGGAARFVVPTPSREVRRAIESARAASTASPQHERERADATPDVLRTLWRELLDAARQLALSNAAPPPAGDADYDPDIYVAVYAAALRSRRWESLPIDVIASPAGSVYDIRAPVEDLAPTVAEAEAWVAEVERRYPDAGALERETAAWWRA